MRAWVFLRQYGGFCDPVDLTGKNHGRKPSTDKNHYLGAFAQNPTRLASKTLLNAK